MPSVADMTTNKITVWMQMSLDGRTEGPNGEFDWPAIRGEVHAHFVDTLRDAGMFLYGRRVYEMMAAYWPTADESPASTPAQAQYSKIWKPMPKLVFSRSLDTTDWNTTVLRDVDADVEQHVRKADGDAYLFGGAETVSAFAARDLIDEYQVFVHPVVLGGGTPLFPALPDRQKMTLVGTRTFDDTVVGLRYARAR
jgi:dihydrofolate reductase